ncbi:MAG: DNA polymerase III subunit alpha [Ignavibacteria bacterium]|nr:DNA polymerase III subunit alpha [Ignavibacteria bacterium]
MPEFIHLHNHSHYSLLDAISTIDGLVDAAVENKMKALALTDHGVMYGIMEFYKKAKSKGVKPIVGCEVYVAQSGSRFDKGKKNIKSISEVEEMSVENSDGLTSSNINYAHLILLAKNETGYRNLLKLTSIGHTEGYYYKPRIDIEVLNQYSEGLIASSACAGGVISCYITRDDLKTAEKMTGVYKDIFGEDFYLEIQDHDIPAEKKVMIEMPKLAKKFGLKLIATNDVHYIKKEHAIAHNIYLHISAKQSAKAAKSYEPKDLLTNLRYGTDQIYFKSAKEMCDLFSEFPEAIRSTLEVTEKCNLELDTSKNFMPNYLIPEEDKKEAKTFDEYLEKLSFEGLEKIKNEFLTNKEIAEERLRYELAVIRKMDFSGYFLIVKDFINYARSKGILVGPGRGSAAGSLVCYCIGITNVNPLEYDLLFERFLNPERVSMPDIDIDFQDDRRDEVIHYAKEKYGESSVAQIVTFNKLAPRGVLKDVGRVLNFPFQEINDLTKTIPILFGKVKKLSECMKEEPDFKKYFETGDAAQKTEKKKLYDYCLVLENLNKNSSIHASGVVIAPGDVTDYTPLSKVTGEDNVFCTQYDMNQLEDAGMIKIDFLGLKELKVIGRIFKLINEKYGKNLTEKDIPLDDPKTYELFSSGSTIGIFQFSKSKMRESLSKLKPKNINDLAAMNALYRPGPMKLIPDFIDKRNGKKPISYLHPTMENTLKETYGIIVYQEQVMQIARDVAGFSLAEADNMRKAMGKKIKEKMIQIKEKFVSGAMKNDVSKKSATEIFNLILDFADYGFNKSHGVAYSILAFYTAYLKTHYPLEFLAVSMACRKDDETELQQLANECKKMKVKLRPPDINEGEMDFSIRYADNEEYVGEIIYGLSALKNVGEKAAGNIMSERNLNGNYTSFMDFLKRVDLRLVNKKALESLIFAGAFDSVEINRRKLFLNIERATFYAQRYSTSEEAKGQEDLFGVNKTKQHIEEYIIENHTEFPESEKYNKEKAAIGFYVTGHPLSKYERDINNFIDLTFGEDPAEIELAKMKSATMCGVINDVQVKVSKKGNKFVVFNLVDLYGSGECIAFSRLYESKTKLFENDTAVIIKGVPEDNGDKIKLIAEEIYSIDTFLEIFTKNLIIHLNEHKTDVSKLNIIKDVVEKNPGNSNLFFNIINGSGPRAFKSKEYRIKATKELISNLKNIVGENNLNLN